MRQEWDATGAGAAVATAPGEIARAAATAPGEIAAVAAPAPGEIGAATATAPGEIGAATATAPGEIGAAACRRAGQGGQWETQRARMVGQLGETRLLHSLLVADEAVIMGRRFGGDLTRLALAGLLHDGAKEMPTPALLALAEAQGLITDPAERARPSILHGPVAAWLAERHWGISDPVILEAIRFHTTGGPGMSREACIIFMADLIEPSRDYPGVELLRRLCRQDLRAAMIEAINQTFDYLARKKQPVHAGMTRCLEWLRQEKGGLPRMESKEMAIIAARAMAAKKGAKITVLKLEDLTLITDFFVVATGSSRTQTQAMAGGAEDELKKHGIRPHRIEGFREGRWILLDFGQVIIHIFQTDERDFYNLERLWADAPALPAEEVLPE